VEREMKLTNLDEIKDLLTENGVKFSCTDFIPADEFKDVPAIMIPWDGSQRVVDLLNDTGIYFGSERLYNQRVIY
jgi:hypothetical protein